MSLVTQYGDNDRAIKALDQRVDAFRKRVISLADQAKDSKALVDERFVDDLMIEITNLATFKGEAIVLHDRKRELTVALASAE